MMRYKPQEIECRHCGCVDNAIIKSGKAPHAFELRCVNCNMHYKWASEFDVRDFSKEELLEKQQQEQERLSKAIIDDNYGEKISAIKRLEKIARQTK